MNAWKLVLLGVMVLWGWPAIAGADDPTLDAPAPEVAIPAEPEPSAPSAQMPAQQQTDAATSSVKTDAVFAPPALQSVAPSRPDALTTSETEQDADSAVDPAEPASMAASTESDSEVTSDVEPEAVAEVTAFDERLALGYADAQHVMGRRFEEGDGVPVDLMKAGDYYFKSASQGYAEAQSDLGRFYASGIGIRKDINLAFDWFLQAAEQGLADAQFNTALILQRGLLGEAKPAAAADHNVRVIHLQQPRPLLHLPQVPKIHLAQCAVRQSAYPPPVGAHAAATSWQVKSGHVILGHSHTGQCM